MTCFLLLWIVLLMAQGQEVSVDYNPTLGTEEKPTLVLSTSEAIDTLMVRIEANGSVHHFTKEKQPANTEHHFSWSQDLAEPSAQAIIQVVFESGVISNLVIPMEFSYGTSLTINHNSIMADHKAKKITLQVTGYVETAEVIVLAAEKNIIEQQSIDIKAGPGEITIPWTGVEDEVVLLDVMLRNERSFAGFTYSPWSLEIPHLDVLFRGNSAMIVSEEEWKLEATLTELQSMVYRYGSVIPVRLYIAGCHNTIGDDERNTTLSTERVRAISSWLRDHGYQEPIYYYGFSEDRLTCVKPDGIKKITSHKVRYIMSAELPSELIEVQWRELQ